jgi:predicted phosphodiesterase
MRIWAISDLHVAIAQNRHLVEGLPAHQEDWLVLAGDVAEKPEDLAEVLDLLRPRFKQLVWVPGNHELWTLPGAQDAHLQGEARYRFLVDLCQARGVLTPEDPYPVVPVPHEDGTLRHWLLAPLFVGYDYSFAPDGMGPSEAIAWAGQEGVQCADEHLLHHAPYPSRQAWCAARCEWTERRLASATAVHGGPVMLVNHYPLRRDLAQLPAIPRFAIWCGTRRTHDWPQRFGASVVVSGHLHLRATRIIDGVRFEEVSLGYPREWTRRGPHGTGLRRILPGP